MSDEIVAESVVAGPTAEEVAKAQKAVVEQMLAKRHKGNLLKIREDYKEGYVVLMFDGVEYPLPIFKAREFALQIRQSCNRIERHK